MTTKTRTALLTLVVAILLSFVSAAPASAATVQNRSGYTGSITLKGAMTIGQDQMVYNTCCSYVLKRFTNAGFTAYPTTAFSGRQTISAMYGLQRWNGSSWVIERQSGTYSGTVSPGGSLSFPAVTLESSNRTGQFPYRIVISVMWTRTYAGTTLGGENVVSNRLADNVCSTRFTRCTPYTDSVVM